MHSVSSCSSIQVGIRDVWPLDLNLKDVCSTIFPKCHVGKPSRFCSDLTVPLALSLMMQQFDLKDGHIMNVISSQLIANLPILEKVIDKTNFTLERKDESIPSF